MKKAFTLAETLLVLLIIGILIGLCLGAGRSSLQNAYNLYYYQAVTTLNISFNDFIHRQLHTTVDTDGKTIGVTNPCEKLLNHIENLRSDSFNITYTCSDSTDYFSNIEITVPKIKTYKDNRDTDNFFALFSTGYNHKGDMKSNELSPEIILIPRAAAGYDLVIDNHYILPTFVDDGEIGRDILDADGNVKYTPVVPQSYRWSYCASADETKKNTLMGHFPHIFKDLMCPAAKATELGIDDAILDAKFKGQPIRFLKPSIMR